MMFVDFLDVETGLVNYEALAKSEDFARYERDTVGLKEVDPTRFSRDERLAFFLNVYNALVIHSFVRLKKPENIAARMGLYATASYDIGGNVYCLNDIEHNVLRGNKKQAYDPLKLLTFTESDPRYRTIIKPTDPRIHFGLNCGAMSCPPIRFYTADNVEFALGASTESFIASDDNVLVLLRSRTVFLSKIFQWYKEDFAPSGEDLDLLQWIADNADEEKAKALRGVIDAPGTLSIKWLPYDWNLNEQ